MAPSFVIPTEDQPKQTMNRQHFSSQLSCDMQKLAKTLQSCADEDLLRYYYHEHLLDIINHRLRLIPFPLFRSNYPCERRGLNQIIVTYHQSSASSNSISAVCNNWWDASSSNLSQLSWGNGNGNGHRENEANQSEWMSRKRTTQPREWEQEDSKTGKSEVTPRKIKTKIDVMVSFSSEVS